jgi:hypothetical protein
MSLFDSPQDKTILSKEPVEYKGYKTQKNNI